MNKNKSSGTSVAPQIMIKSPKDEKIGQDRVKEHEPQMPRVSQDDAGVGVVVEEDQQVRDQHLRPEAAQGGVDLHQAQR